MNHQNKSCFKILAYVNKFYCLRYIYFQRTCTVNNKNNICGADGTLLKVLVIKRKHVKM